MNTPSRWSALAGLGWSLVLTVAVQAQDAPARKRVAVLDFEYQTVHQYVYDVFGSDVDIGKGIANMLVTNLVRNGTYSVIERQALDKILSEQNFQQSGRADVSTAASIGKLLGVDAIIIGAITQFGRDDKSLRAGGAGVGPIRVGGFGKKTAKATVVLDARIIDVQTGEILAVATGKGESKRGGVALFGASGGTAGGVDMGSSNFANTIIGEATKEATDSLVAEVVGAATKIVQRKVEISGVVADVSGAEVTINVGSSGGVRNGETYEVTRPGREVKDPSTGRVIRRVTTPVGTVKITSVDADFSTGQMIGGPALVNDCVGKCPAGKQQSQAEPAPAPAPAAAPVRAAPVAVASGGPIALPSGPWSWTPYQFRGTEHFRYDVKQTDGGKAQNGYYALDVQPAGEGRFRMKVDGKLGSDEYSSTITAPSANGGMGGMGMGQMMALGPIGITLFNPVAWMFFMGHEMTLGDGWSQSSGGTKNSVKVESKCDHAGVGGLMTVVRENDDVMMQTCVSPKVALPLAISTKSGGADLIEMTLVEYRP